MHIEQILAKDINRPLDGVVKASNSAQLVTEVNEYVITDEVARHLSDLLDVYTHPGDPRSNGVWIAGFFGSGKSHLLKMLAHLLGDVSGAGITRAEVVSTFVRKVPAGDALLKAALERSASIPARSLLFNIDEKVDKNEKDQPDALLKVFVQVFYEASGFFGRSPYIARFERDLASQGLYEQFKEAFARQYGQPWDKGRELAVFAEPAAEKAYSEVTGAELERPLTAYRESYSVSIESFADEVAAWLDQQPEPRTRLGFFIDEIGQFIGQDTKLMLSLQTIAETLFTRCHGRAWVVVTSQEIMDSIIGDRTRQQQLDFSKIQARFAIQLKLDSKNVREVVSKRLLEKTPNGATSLGAVYTQNADRFRSLFAFRDQRSYQNYASVDDFVGTYPFVDYQFELFHTAMKGLSDYNAFTGRHASVGERSLLGVTKEIGSAMKAAEVGSLATFDMFYDGIEKSVLSDVKRNVSLAARNLMDPDAALAVRVLKALLMTKYDDQFEASAQSLAVLLTPAIDTNVAALRDDVERALQLLVRNTYVQRTGSTYTYLTNEEQDVEKAIKGFDRNDAAIKKLLNEEVVQASGVTAKVRHDGTGADLGLERFLDGERQGRSEKLGVHFVTPLRGYSLEDVKFRSVGDAGTVFVVLELDQRALDEIDLHVRTRDYVQLQLTSTLPESRRRILESHQRSNVERHREVTSVLRQAVAGAELVHNGSVLAIGGGSAKERVHAGLQMAIESRYTRINEARGVAAYKEADLPRILRDEDTLDIDAKSSLDTLAQTVVVQLRQSKLRQVSSNVGLLVEEFADPPCGWSMTTVLVAIAHGVKTGRVRLKLDSRVLVRTEIPGELRNTGKHRKIYVDEVREQDPAKVRKLQRFLGSYRDVSDTASTAEDLVRRVRNALTEDLAQVTGWASMDYPFGAEVERAITTIRAAAEGHDDDWYLADFLITSDELLELKEDVLDPLRAFLSGPQQKIFDDARAFLDRRGAELDNTHAADADALRRGLDSPTFFRGSGIPQIKQAHLQLRGRLETAVAAERIALRRRVEQRLDELVGGEIFTDAVATAQQQARSRFQSLLSEIDAKSSLGQVALARSNFDVQFESIVEILISSRAEPTPEPEPPPGEDTRERPAKSVSQSAVTTAKKTTVRLDTVIVEGVPMMLATREQVETYVTALRTSLLTAIEDGKTIIR
ncbi:BREX system P-loop protein BrxC [Antrihabitans cavernicola]|uniref:BREX system P-loop protein BrxC n=1 Tax=Antrihabitans cavernicola TaxID=2495913 RepID=A0A5A7S610_9NOCA|nr:BREX system P-loop protein BrxC [Spelaeibacter cavernicola]KAA0021560.1 BREX system P-loop protein BrxC [Spelaeibacter cavernicola]